MSTEPIHHCSVDAQLAARNHARIVDSQLILAWHHYSCISIATKVEREPRMDDCTPIAIVGILLDPIQQFIKLHLLI